MDGHDGLFVPFRAKKRRRRFDHLKRTEINSQKQFVLVGRFSTCENQFTAFNNKNDAFEKSKNPSNFKQFILKYEL